ncbi:MAG: hypothetical protein K9K93_07955 [Acholeplasmataceae bacterium]|nr:hypothetical protein [Acholeplasmataceae bacterium]
MSKEDLKVERMRILDLLTKGVINADQAEKLLNALERSPDVAEAVVAQKKAPFRMLKINVDSNDGDVVKIQIPIEFARLLKSGKFNINLDDSDLDIDTLIEMINSGAVGELVNIKSSDGDVVRIVVE